jgi:hypothetical protein
MSLFWALPLMATLAAAAEPPQTGPGSLAGVWFNAKFSVNRDDNLPQELPRARMTVDGQPPPFQPWAKAEVERRLQASKTVARSPNSAPAVSRVARRR